MLKFIAPIAIATAALVSAPAFAGSAEAPTAKVEYSDLDLATEQGRKTLDGRIKVAAKSLCPPQQRTGSRIRPKNDCYETAMKSVREQLAAKGVGVATASR